MRATRAKTQSSGQSLGRLSKFIKIRAEGDLKEALRLCAKRNRKDVSEYIREELWSAVDREERLAKKAG